MPLFVYLMLFFLFKLNILYFNLFEIITIIRKIYIYILLNKYVIIFNIYVHLLKMVFAHCFVFIFHLFQSFCFQPINITVYFKYFMYWFLSAYFNNNYN